MNNGEDSSVEVRRGKIYEKAMKKLGKIIEDCSPESYDINSIICDEFLELIIDESMRISNMYNLDSIDSLFYETIYLKNTDKFSTHDRFFVDPDERIFYNNYPSHMGTCVVVDTFAKILVSIVIEIN